MKSLQHGDIETKLSRLLLAIEQLPTQGWTFEDEKISVRDGETEREQGAVEEIKNRRLSLGEKLW